ncbi:MAG: SDR family oxidoreductase [Saprospiraceae bacterium]|nr:SDR family oxidoreductase [Saprospiraceae bacterium]
MKFSLENKSAIVTGGASGIGRAIVEVFVEMGARVHVLDIHTTAPEWISGSPMGKIFYHMVDITLAENVAQIMDRIGNETGIDILVNNAGIAHIGNAVSTEPVDFEKVMRVNVHGAYHCIHYAIPYMVAKRGGSIVNIASTVASIAIANRFAYMTSKGAILSMTYSVALDYIDQGIRCNAISPGRVHTPFVDGFIAKNYPGREAEMFEKLSKDHPIGRMAKPEEIAHLALYLCSDEAAYVTGSNHSIDGGFTKLKQA